MQIQPQGKKPPFFCVHAAGGHVLGFTALARYLGVDQPFYALEAPGRDGEQPPLKTIEALAERYINEILSVEPDGPYYLGGHSMGGVVAFEMAQQLIAQGKEIALLVLIDTYCPHGTNSFAQTWRKIERLAYVTKRAAYHSRNLLSLSLPAKTGYLKAKGQSFRSMMIPDSPVRRSNERAARKYVPKSFPERLHLFWSGESSDIRSNRRWGWEKLAEGGLEIHKIPGGHVSMMREPNLKVLAEQLEVCLNEAQQVGKQI